MGWNAGGSCMAVMLLAAVAVVTGPAVAQTGPRSLRDDISVALVATTPGPSQPVRLARDPRNDALYILKLRGQILSVDLATPAISQVYSSADHGQTNAQGLAIGPDGTMYLVGNSDVGTAETKATIRKGVLAAGGARTWSTLAETVPYPKSNTAYDHRFNGIVVSPDGRTVYVNSGSRTDHGEIQTAGGVFPGAREVGLTACILRLPAAGQGISLPNDRAALKAAGYIFAEGTRNSFDLTFAPNGDLLATENGPGRDHSEELNWLRAGRHFGFPWRMGGTDNPQQYPTYDPAKDRLLNPLFPAVSDGLYHNDPTFPPRPAVTLLEPIPSEGPDADKIRTPGDGLVKDASDRGWLIRSFTAHRSPLGLAFDRTGAMGAEFHSGAFMLSWTEGDADEPTLIKGPFLDASQDLLFLDLRKINGAYRMRPVKLVEGFTKPIDAEVIGKSIYVLEYGGSQGLWRVTLP